MKSSLLMALFFCSLGSASAQTAGLEGNWKTPGGAVVQIARCGPDLCATLRALEPNAPVQVDAKDPDPSKHNDKLCGMRIGYGFHRTDPTHADGGHLYDPKSGKTYNGTLSSEGDTLDLRGYVGIKAFGRTERWTRTAAPVPPCPQ